MRRRTRSRRMPVACPDAPLIVLKPRVPPAGSPDSCKLMSIGYPGYADFGRYVRNCRFAHPIQIESPHWLAIHWQEVHLVKRMPSDLNKPSVVPTQR